MNRIAGTGTSTLTLLLVLAAAAGAVAGSPSDTGPVVRTSGGCGSVAPATPGETGSFSLTVGDLEREYRLHLPSGYDPGRPVSLVLVVHGYTGTAEGIEEYSGFSAHADEHGYAVLYPQSTSFTTDDGLRITSWNDLAGSASPGPEGPICSETAYEYAHPPECGEPTPCNWASCHDDVRFIVALLDHLEATVCVDLDRVYATGMSNGGMFVHRLGCDLPERFAAIAPVGGTLARGFNCAPGGATPLSMMNVYGTRDDYVSQKGVVSSDGYYYLAAREVLAKWAEPAAQDCDRTETPYPIDAATLGMECIQRDNCSTGAEVAHCGWDGAHDWPQRGQDNVGTRMIWEFFSKHSRDGYQEVGE